MTVFDAERMGALVGESAEAERFAVGGADVVLGPSGTLIIAEAADVPGRSGVWNAEEFRLFGPAPASVTDRLMESPLHIAVRTGAEVLYLGTAFMSQCAMSDGVLTDCELLLDTPLSRDLLDRVRPPGPPVDLPGLGWLEEVNGDRAAALEEFVTTWYPAGTESDHDAAHPTPPLPPALRHLHRLARQRPAALGAQNRILPGSDPRTDPLGEMIVFGVENQGGFFWSLLWTLDAPDLAPDVDPTVWFRCHDEPPIAEREPLSGFLLQFALYEASMGAAHLALARGLTRAEVEHLTRNLRPVPLRPFQPGSATRFHVAPGLVLHVDAALHGDRYDAWAGATHRSALTPLADVPVTWTRFDG
ncbi:hypothetical protein [Streptomyces sp. NPDC048606]|uniref:hypothetical protein n=1 Tax=Streptomyces sp. NPDC048606 TaxID=3154726 RepID=UPI00343C26D9